jgi:predicted anti-sigma-YlaC factor YlaD
MHPSNATLIAFHDAETGASRSRRISMHLAKCEKCRNRLGRIESERDELSARAAAPASDVRQGLSEVLAAIAAWQEGRDGAAASELRDRLRWQIETYFGARAGSAVFLGPEAAEAVRDEVFRGLDWAAPAGEICR